MARTRILIVEDEWIIANDIRMKLEDMGYDVPTVVSTGEQAIEKAEEIKPDLILMDIMLEGAMDGIEAAKQIHSRFDIPFIFLTAYSDKRILERAKITEPFGYLLKPFKTREIQIVIEIALYKYTMEKKLKESEKWLSTAFNSIYDAVITTDAEGHVTFMNPVAVSLTGWKQDDAQGKPIEEVFNILNEKKGNRAESPVEKVIRECVCIGSLNHILIRKDKSKIYTDNSAAPIKNEMGEIIGIILSFRDITERRQMEEQIKSAEKLAALGRMAAGVAHELNSPLTGIVTFSHLLLNRIPPENKMDIEDLKVIIDQAERCSKIITGLLGFSRSMPAEKGLVDVNRTIDYTHNIVCNQSKFHNIKIVKDLQPTLPKIKGDSTQMEQVLLNLLINAADAMDDKGNIIIKTREVNKEGDNYIEIEFTDSGPGIPENYIGQIFDPFFTTKPVGKGTGLGLSVSHGIIQKQGGLIGVKNKPGMGASFFIRLPVTK